MIASQGRIKHFILSFLYRELNFLRAHEQGTVDVNRRYILYMIDKLWDNPINQTDSDGHKLAKPFQCRKRLQ